MADAKTKKDAEQDKSAPTPGATQPKTLGIRLVPVGNSDQPVLANYTTLNAAPGAGARNGRMSVDRAGAHTMRRYLGRATNA